MACDMSGWAVEVDGTSYPFELRPADHSYLAYIGEPAPTWRALAEGGSELALVAPRGDRFRPLPNTVPTVDDLEPRCTGPTPTTRSAASSVVRLVARIATRYTR